MSTNKVSMTINIPDISSEDYKFAANYWEHAISGFALLLYTLLWRAQIAHSQSSGSISKKDLQGVPSMRFTARLIGNNELIQGVLAAFAVFQSSFFDQAEYVKVPIEDRRTFIENRIKDITAPGKAKILSARQINSYEDLIMHRRGLMAKCRGTLQASTIYNPTSIVRGISISHITWENFLEWFSFAIEKYIPESQSLENLLRYTISSYYPEIILANSENLKDLIKIIVDCNIYPESSEELSFEDGIVVSDDSKNKVPLEFILDLTRNKPAVLAELPSDIDTTNDPFLSSAVRQQREMKKKDQDLFLGDNKKSRNKKR